MTDKTCPDCAETIKVEALVCRFCGRRFEPEVIEAQIGYQRDADTNRKKTVLFAGAVAVFIGAVIVLTMLTPSEREKCESAAADKSEMCRINGAGDLNRLASCFRDYRADFKRCEALP